jgi:hypothetical protein
MKKFVELAVGDVIVGASQNKAWPCHKVTGWTIYGRDGGLLGYLSFPFLVLSFNSERGSSYLSYDVLTSSGVGHMYKDDFDFEVVGV